MDSEFRIVTFNIRCDYGVDGNNNFCFRRDRIRDKLKKEAPDVVCFQEVLPHVFRYLTETLTDYTVVGCGRSAALSDEQMTIAFRKDRYELLALRNSWLSETPEVPGSRYPNQSECPRVLTEAWLQELETGKVLRVCNTHLDHISGEAREEGLTQVMKTISIPSFYHESLTVFVGDLNAEPQDPELQVMKSYPEFRLLSEGIGITFHGFYREEKPMEIDYIYASGSYRHISTEKWTDKEDGVYLSDHYPVAAVLTW